MSAPLHTGRHSHACSLAHEGEVVVVAGGLTELQSDNTGGTVSVEMLELSSLRWHTLEELPHPIYGGDILTKRKGLFIFATAGQDSMYPVIYFFRRSVAKMNSPLLSHKRI